MGDRCECHECTQARWKASFQGQFEASIQNRLDKPKPPKNVRVFWLVMSLYKRNKDGRVNWNYYESASDAEKGIRELSEYWEPWAMRRVEMKEGEGLEFIAAEAPSISSPAKEGGM